MPRLLIAEALPRAISWGADPDAPYAGMDRRLLRPLGLSEAALLRGLALEALPLAEAERGWPALARELDQASGRRHELLALGELSRPGWERLGLDVGETDTTTVWSALAHRWRLLPAAELPNWALRLNAHGLFDDPADARAFLERYFECEDPDRDWMSTDGEVCRSGYGLVPIHRLRVTD